MTPAEPVAMFTACPALSDARETLAAVLVGDTAFETSLAVSEAVEVLSDVRPHLPPLTYPTTALGAEVGVRQALEHLVLAVEQAGDAEEAVRAGRAAAILRSWLKAEAHDSANQTVSGR